MPLIIVPENIPTLPANAAVTYLDEGAANIVYQISIPYPSPSTSIHEEYGDGTPPPSEIEIPDDGVESPGVDLAVFDGMYQLDHFHFQHNHQLHKITTFTRSPSYIQIGTNTITDKLLRLRKSLATAPTCFTSQAAYLRLIAPLFDRSQLVEQTLVKVNPTTLIQRLNFELQVREKNPDKMGPYKGGPDSKGRYAKRHGTYLAEDGYGLLITDMTPGM